MPGFLSLLAGVVMLSGIFAAPAVADDLTTCKNASGDEVIAACTRAMSSGKVRGIDLAIAHNNRGLAIELKGDHDRAIADFTEAIRLNPRNSITFSNRATAWYRKGDHDRAIADFDEAIRIKPSDEITYRGRGNAWMAKGEYDRAIGDYSEAIRISPKDAVAYNNRGVSYISKGDYARAITDFTEAIRINPKNASSLFGRARALESRGEYGNALTDYKTVLVLDPRDKYAQEGIRRIEQKQVSATKPVSPQPVQPSATGNEAENRIALVIGNGSYANFGALLNPGNDARAMEATLKTIGFRTVTLLIDLRRERLLDALKIFARDAEKADWAVIYFAGHGLELGGVNYLVPVDAKLSSDRDASFEAIDLQKVLDVVGGARKIGLVILDACRDNPFLKTMTRSMASTRSIGRGLAPIEPGGATLVAYAARHGQVAQDGEGKNSPFVTALIKNLEVPGIEIGLLFRKVRDDVLALTGRRQEPFIYGSLPSEAFYFRRP